MQKIKLKKVKKTGSYYRKDKEGTLQKTAAKETCLFDPDKLPSDMRTWENLGLVEVEDQGNEIKGKKTAASPAPPGPPARVKGNKKTTAKKTVAAKKKTAAKDKLKTAFKLVNSETEGMYNVMNTGTGNNINDKPLSKKDAELLINESKENLK